MFDIGDLIDLGGADYTPEAEYLGGLLENSNAGDAADYVASQVVPDYGPEAEYLGGLLEGSNSGEAAAYLQSQLAKLPSSDLQSLAASLGIKLPKDPLSSLSMLVGALGAIRNSGPNGAQRQAAMANVLNLAGTKQPYSEANTITAARKPVYRTADQFIVTPPASAGPLTLIKTGGK